MPVSTTSGRRPGGGLAALLTVSAFGPAAATAGASTFTTADLPAVARSQHVAVLLPDGDVLVAGGFSFGTILSSAERFDPARGTWSSAASMSSPRGDPAVALLP